MFKLFGSKKQQAPAPVQPKKEAQSSKDSIQKLKKQIEILEKREQLQQTKVDALVKDAKAKMAKKDIDGVKFALKKKKMLEAEIKSIQGQQMNLQTTMLSLEKAQINIQTYQVQSNAKETFDGINKVMNVDSVQDVFDELQDLMEDQKEVDNVLSGPLGDQPDDEELEDELAGLMEDDEEEEKVVDTTPQVVAPTVPEGPILPNVPTGDITVQHKTEEEQALADLMAEMN